MSEEQPIVDTTAIDTTNEPVENIATFDDEPHTAQAPVVEPLTPPTGDAVDEHTPELVSPNNVKTMSNVELTYDVYSQPNGPYAPWPLIITPKHLKDIPFNTQNYTATANDQKDPEVIQQYSTVMFGLGNQAGPTYTEEDLYERVLNNPVNKWVQELEYANKIIGLKTPTIKPSKTDRTLAGSAARDRISAILGLGTSIRIPLPHSGFSINLRARGDVEYLNLDFAQNQAQAFAGNQTFGLIYHNSNIFTVQRVWEFIQGSITHANVKDFADLDLGDIIPVTELPTLQWGQACTMYPTGYPLDLPCSAGFNVCRHVEHVLLNLNKIYWFNSTALSNSQLSMLANSGKDYPVNEIKQYQTMGNSPFTKRVALNDQVEILLKVPTINEYINAGIDWINKSVEAAKLIFVNETEDADKIAKYVSEVVGLNALREYSHWIEAIVVERHDRIVGTDAICETLETLSSQTDLTDKAFKEIQTFIEDVTVGIVAIPNFACPKCQKDYVTDENSKHPELIALDMMKHFFHLKDRRLYRPTQSQIN